MESEKIIQNPRFNTNSIKLPMPSNDLSQKQPPSLLDRFRVLLKQKEEQAAQAKAIAAQVKEPDSQDSDADTPDEGDDTVLRRKPLGKTP